MKILELYFILFSKLYVKFSKREDDWFYLPLMIISTIFCYNILIISLLFVDISPYYIIALIAILFFVLIYVFSPKRAKGKSYVRNYKLSTYTILILVTFLLIDFYGLLQIMNYNRDKIKSLNPEKIDKKTRIEDFNKMDCLYKLQQII
jgi:hypothetical protein